MTKTVITCCIHQLRLSHMNKLEIRDGFIAWFRGSPNLSQKYIYIKLTLLYACTVLWAKCSDWESVNCLWRTTASIYARLNSFETFWELEGGSWITCNTLGTVFPRSSPNW
jgi:hypothetical protein